MTIDLDAIQPPVKHRAVDGTAAYGPWECVCGVFFRYERDWLHHLYYETRRERDALLDEVERLRDALRRFRGWDDLLGRGDGPYWILEATWLLGDSKDHYLAVAAREELDRRRALRAAEEQP